MVELFFFSLTIRVADFKKFGCEPLYRLGWLELQTTLAKLHFKFDLTLLNTELDWHRDSEMHLLWKKPPLMIRISPASAQQAKSATTNT